MLSKARTKIKKKTVFGLIVLTVFYVAVLFADFLSPYDYRQQFRQHPSAPPSSIRFRDSGGDFQWRPFVYPVRLEDPLSMRYSEVGQRPASLALFVRGYRYEFLGIFPADIHLFGVIGDSSPETPRIQLLGTDNLGRDRFSRMLSALRFSLIVSPLGTALACLIGVFVGVVSGYSGPRIDAVLMGVSDVMMSLPTLILILAVRAAFPLELSPGTAASLLIVVFALTGWAEMARLARGLVWSMREREFVLAAKAAGLTNARILFRHILPNISRPLLTQATLILPAFLLAEVTLSFLGVGLQEPEASLGNMLTAASDINQLAASPVLLLVPAILIFLFVLGVRLVSDGLKEP